MATSPVRATVRRGARDQEPLKGAATCRHRSGRLAPPSGVSRRAEGDEQDNTRHTGPPHVQESRRAFGRPHRHSPVAPRGRSSERPMELTGVVCGGVDGRRPCLAPGRHGAPLAIRLLLLCQPGTSAPARQPALVRCDNQAERGGARSPRLGAAARGACSGPRRPYRWSSKTGGGQRAPNRWHTSAGRGPAPGASSPLDQTSCVNCYVVLRFRDGVEPPDAQRGRSAEAQVSARCPEGGPHVCANDQPTAANRGETERPRSRSV
jgi:hypothetical protein